MLCRLMKEGKITIRTLGATIPAGNSGMRVLGVTNFFLLEAYSMAGEVKV